MVFLPALAEWLRLWKLNPPARQVGVKLAILDLVSASQKGSDTVGEPRVAHDLALHGASTDCRSRVTVWRWNRPNRVRQQYPRVFVTGFYRLLKEAN